MQRDESCTKYQVQGTKYQEGCTKYNVPRLSRSKRREARSEMFEDKDCSSIQWFPTSTFCTRRSAFDIGKSIKYLVSSIKTGKGF